MTFPENLVFFDSSNQKGTYTTRDNKKVDISLEALLKIVGDLPDPPACLAFDIKAFDMLPSNTMFISSDLADKIESLIKD